MTVIVNYNLLTEVLLATRHDRGKAIFKSLTISKLDVACARHLEHGWLVPQPYHLAKEVAFVRREATGARMLPACGFGVVVGKVSPSIWAHAPFPSIRKTALTVIITDRPRTCSTVVVKVVRVAIQGLSFLPSWGESVPAKGVRGFPGSSLGVVINEVRLALGTNALFPAGRKKRHGT
jgi:hypothetical protein